MAVLFRKSQQEMDSWQFYTQRPRENNEKETRIKRAKVALNLEKRGYLKKSLKKIPILTFENRQIHKWTAEPLSALFSPLAQELDKFGIPGQNKDEKRRNMNILSRTNFKFCWERLICLKHCFKPPLHSIIPKDYVEDWALIRDVAWQTTWERCEIERLQFASMVFRQKPKPQSSATLNVFLSVELEIHRSDYENHLKAFQEHIHNQILILENSKRCEEIFPSFETESYGLISEGTQKANFVVQLAREYWEKYPKAIYDEVFSYYLSRCPRGKILSRESWERIVRERKLDPRKPGTKKRGKAKKTLQI